jgi:hypothetical protein
LLAIRWRIDHKQFLFRAAFEFVLMLDLSTATTENADQTIRATIAFKVEAMPDGFSLHPDGHTGDC